MFSSSRHFFYNLMLFVGLSPLLFGCAISPSHQAQEFMDAGHSHANYVRMSNGNQRVLETYGRVSGDSEQPLTIDELTRLQAISGEYFSAGIYAPSQLDAVEIKTALSFPELVDDEPDFLAGLAEALDVVMSNLADVRSLNPHIRIVAAPAGSGVSVATSQSIDGEGEVSFTVVIGVGDDAANATFVWWKETAAMTAHELLRFQHELAPPDPLGSRVNRATSAYLFGQCAVSWFAEGLGASSLAINIELDPDAFPGILEGRFSPNMARIRQIGSESRQGRTLAFAYIYHLAAEDGGAVDLLSGQLQERLIPQCRLAPSTVRDFSGGFE